MFITNYVVILQEAMQKDVVAGHPGVTKEQVFELMDLVCLNAGDIFVYLEANVLSVADAYFRFTLGDEVFENMRTNNFSEAQNSRFDRFVGTSTRVGTVAELVNNCITYVNSAGNLYHVAETRPGAEQRKVKKTDDPSVSMPPLHLGKMLHNQRKLKAKAPQEAWIGLDEMDEHEEGGHN